jgi:hypothetical protein
MRWLTLRCEHLLAYIIPVSAALPHVLLMALRAVYLATDILYAWILRVHGSLEGSAGRLSQL